MLGTNRWELLHRLSTTYTLAAAFGGGAAVYSFIKGLLKMFGHPNLPWWGDLCVAGALSVLIFWLLRKASKNIPDPIPIPHPARDPVLPGSTAILPAAANPVEHPPNFDQVRYAYRQLRGQEKIALALVHRNPNMDFNTAQERIGEFYSSAGPMDALRVLMNTKPKLVDTSEHSELFVPAKLHAAVSEILVREPPF